LTGVTLVLFLLFSPQADFRTEFVKGLKALNGQDLATARESLTAAARMQPANARVQVALAQTYWRLKQPVLATAAAQKAEKLGARDPVTLRALAAFYAEGKDFSKAGDMEARCAAEDPGDPDAALRSMTDYMEASEPKKAIALAVSLPGWENRAGIRNLLGKAYEADGQILKTLPELQTAIRLKPDDESYYFDLIQTLLNHYNFEAAAQTCEVGRKRFPRSAQMALAAGVAYYGQNRQSDAIQAFLDSVDLDPAPEQPYFFLSRLLNEARDKRPAIERRFVEYEAAHPDSYLGWFLHAKALMAELREPAQAEALLKKSISLDGRFWESHYLLGVLLGNRRAFGEAEKELRVATELNPRDPAPHYRLFRALAAEGKTREAEAELATQRKVSAEYQADLNRSVGEVKRLDLSPSSEPKH
jgi:tetratricopeptide (TPR) repeat protein